VGEEETREEESVWVRITRRDGSSLVVGVGYRSPDCSANGDKEFIEVIRKFTRGDCVVMGDFNFPEIDWGTLQANSGRSQQFFRYGE
jgi:hypothetical protein